jgi:hypothetical protein
VREWAVPDVVHQDGRLYCLGFRVKDKLPFLLERLDGFARQVESAQRVLKTRMAGTWIDHRCQTQLIDAIESLKQRVLHDVIKQAAWYFDKPEYRVVDDFCVVHNSSDCKGTKKWREKQKFT